MSHPQTHEHEDTSTAPTEHAPQCRGRGPRGAGLLAVCDSKIFNVKIIFSNCTAPPAGQAPPSRAQCCFSRTNTTPTGRQKHQSFVQSPTALGSVIPQQTGTQFGLMLVLENFEERFSERHSGAGKEPPL